MDDFSILSDDVCLLSSHVKAWMASWSVLGKPKRRRQLGDNFTKHSLYRSTIHHPLSSETRFEVKWSWFSCIFQRHKKFIPQQTQRVVNDWNARWPFPTFHFFTIFRDIDLVEWHFSGRKFCVHLRSSRQNFASKRHKKKVIVVVVVGEFEIFKIFIIVNMNMGIFQLRFSCAQLCRPDENGKLKYRFELRITGGLLGVFFFEWNVE